MVQTSTSYSPQLNTGQLDSSDAGNDLNVERAWLQGLTGCGTVVAVVDDGKQDLPNHSHLALTAPTVNQQ